MERNFDPKVLEKLDEKLRRRITLVLEKDIAEFTEKMPPYHLDEGDVKLGELTYTELVLLTAAYIVGNEGAEFYGRICKNLESKEFWEVSESEIKEKVGHEEEILDRFSAEYFALAQLVSEILYTRLNVAKEVYLEYSQDYSVIKPAIPYPKCSNCGKRRPPSHEAEDIFFSADDDFGILVIRL